MNTYTVKIETENEILYRSFLAENPRKALENVINNLCWIIGNDTDVFAIGIEKINDLPAMIDFNEKDWLDKALAV
jgi:hypothetical protein